MLNKPKNSKRSDDIKRAPAAPFSCTGEADLSHVRISVPLLSEIKAFTGEKTFTTH